MKMIILIQFLKLQMKKILLILILKIIEKLKDIIHKLVIFELNLIMIKLDFVIILFKVKI